MKLFVGVTDWDWWKLHSDRDQIEEVNFWKPSPEGTFRALQQGELFLFKLHSPRNFIAGGGFFSKFLLLPVSLAWEAFGVGNGTASLDEFRSRIARYRRKAFPPGDDPKIGCILLEEPFFWKELDWIPIPEDFKLNTVVGKTYDSTDAAGQYLWEQVQDRLRATRSQTVDPGPALTAATDADRFGPATLFQPRLGQGSFRVLVMDAYQQRCAITGERTLPVLEAAHIRPYVNGGKHELPNGILLRSDLHTLFDRGYLGIDPDVRKVMVSQRIREQFQNGKHYYALHGSPITLPENPQAVPDRQHLLYHAEHVFS